MTQDTDTAAVILETEATKPIVTLDYALYQHYLDNSDLTEKQRQEFLETLWNIIVSFVDLGFGVHPLQQTDSDKRLEDIVDSQSAQSLLNQYNQAQDPVIEEVSEERP